MLAGTDSFHVGKGCDQTDGAVTAHAEVANIIKEDNASCAGGVHRLTQQAPDHDIGSPRFVDHGRSEIIVVMAKALQSFGKGAVPEIRSPAHYKTCRLSAGMGVNHSDSAGLDGTHFARVSWNSVGQSDSAKIKVEVVKLEFAWAGNN
jgi:hypothetical protein